MARTFEDVIQDLQATPETDTERTEELTQELSQVIPTGEPAERPAPGQPGGTRPAGASIPKRQA